MTEDTRCRLCDGSTRLHFTAVVLEKYDCDYLLCEACGSLQSERPYWLEEAYDRGGISDADTGMFLRGINNLAIIYVVSRIARLPARARVLDFGGGSGLLCRMLRDVGFDARVSDRYARNEIAQGFDDLGETPDLMCSFEVAEHFPEPRAGMTSILGRNAPICLVGTELYHGQGKDWGYIGPQTGQHVFFYSHAAMKIMADQHEYVYERVGSMHFFLKRPLGKWRSSILWRSMQPGVLRWVRAYLGLRISSRFAEADNLTARLASAARVEAAGGRASRA